MVLFKLEIPIPGPNWVVLGKMNPLEVFGSVERPHRLTEPFLVGAVIRNEQFFKNAHNGDFKPKHPIE